MYLKDDVRLIIDYFLNNKFKNMIHVIAEVKIRTVSLRYISLKNSDFLFVCVTKRRWFLKKRKVFVKLKK